MNVNKKESPTVKLSISPYPANGEVVELDVLNDLVQQSVSHGVEICKRVGLQRNRQKENVESAGSRQSGNVPGRFIDWLPSLSSTLTWFLSDMRKSSRDPGSPNSMKVFTRRRSALFPGNQEEQL